MNDDDSDRPSHSPRTRTSRRDFVIRTLVGATAFVTPSFGAVGCDSGNPSNADGGGLDAGGDAGLPDPTPSPSGMPMPTPPPSPTPSPTPSPSGVGPPPPTPTPSPSGLGPPPPTPTPSPSGFVPPPPSPSARPG